MSKKQSVFNKKQWIQSHLNEILNLKKQGLTYQGIIQSLKDQHNMPFDLTESLLSRYLNEFAKHDSTTLKTETALNSKIERQKERLQSRNNEIQNLNRRLERVIERNESLLFENSEIKERNRLLENKFLDGEARLKDLRRYNGYNNVHWKVADLTEKNDEMFQSILMLERLSERLAAPHEEAAEKIEKLEKELAAIKQNYADVEHKQVKSTEEIEQLGLKIHALTEEKEALEQQLSEKEVPVIQQDQEKIEQLTQDRQRLIQEKSELTMYARRLKSDLSNSEQQLRETSNSLYESRNNAKQSDLWRIIALFSSALAVACILMFIFL
jgi:chromosome segregation ATPase